MPRPHRTILGWASHLWAMRLPLETKNSSSRFFNMLRSIPRLPAVSSAELTARVKYPFEIAFFLVLTALGLGIYHDYGIAWDEPAQREMGAVTLKHIDDRFAPPGHFDALEDYSE